MNFILSQIFGGVALVLSIISYFFKFKKSFLFIQIIANVFYGFSFAVNFALVAGINTFIYIFKVIILYIYERKEKNPPIYLIFIFTALYILVGIIFFNSYLDILVMITPIMFTIAFYMKNMQTVRYFMLLPNAILVLYAIICQIYTTALLDLLDFTVIIISIIKFHINKKQEIRYLMWLFHLFYHLLMFVTFFIDNCFFLWHNFTKRGEKYVWYF